MLLNHMKAKQLLDHVLVPSIAAAEEKRPLLAEEFAVRAAGEVVVVLQIHATKLAHIGRRRVLQGKAIAAAPRLHFDQARRRSLLPEDELPSSSVEAPS